MSEKNNIFENDLLMRAILEGGQEEVPGRVWDAVSDGLDKADRRKRTVTLWWRRAGVGVAAMAAAVASVLVLDRPETTDLVPAASQSDMIAVVEPETVMTEQEELVLTSQTGGAGLMAYVPKDVQTQAISEPETVEEINAVSETRTVEDAEPVTETNTVPEAKTIGKTKTVTEEKVYFPTVWEEEDESKSLKTSFVLSGITGASGSQKSGHNGIFKAPAFILAPTETGIKDKGLKSSYGLPISVGAGFRFEFTPKWSIGVGLNYTYLSRTFNGTYTHVNDAGIIDNLITSDIRNSQHYIGIPVNAYYNIIDSKKVNFYAYAGGAVEKCVSDKYLVLTNTIVHKEKAKGVQLSANIGLGVEFMLSQHIGLYLDPSLRYYFDCDQPKSIRTAQPLMIGFELGFRFRL